VTLLRNPVMRPVSPPRTETLQRGANPASRPRELFVRTAERQRGDQRASAPRSYVFLHGLGGTQTYWTAANGESHLPPDSTLVDLLGFGRSPRPLIRYTLETHLSALGPVLESQAPSVLVGHSLGASLALAYAAKHPNHVTALVLIGLPSYGGPRGAFRWFRQRLRGWFLTNMVLTALVCVLTRRLLGPILPMLIRDVPPEVARDLVEHNFMSSTTSLWNVLYRRDVTFDLNALPEDLPVLFIHGTDDATAPIGSIRGLVDGRRRSQLVELVGVDHHPWLRHPTECAERISRAWWDVHREDSSFCESGSVDGGVLARRQCTDLSAGPAQPNQIVRNQSRKES